MVKKDKKKRYQFFASIDYVNCGVTKNSDDDVWGDLAKKKHNVPFVSKI